MSYRFVRVTNNYPQYIKSFYSRHPEAHLNSYEDQYLQLTRDSIETSSAYVKNLNKIGVKAFEIITNANILQDTWKKENGLPQNIAEEQLIIEQIKHYEPDVVWIDDLSLANEEWKTKLLKEVPSVKLFVGHHCAPYSETLLKSLKLFDFVFTCTPGIKDDYEKHGIKTFLMYHGFEASILEEISKDNKMPETNFSFSGSLYAGSGFHKSRIEYIEAILKSGIEIDLFCNLESFKKLLLKKVFFFIIGALRTLKLEKFIDTVSALKKNKAFGDTPVKFYSKKLLNSSKPPVFGYEMYQLLSKSNICFNIHGEVAGDFAGNIRLFEATGVGCCLVTDWKSNITELFEPGKEIVTYKTVEECIEKVKWLIDNPEEREKIARAGQERTLKDHTFAGRAQSLNKVLLDNLNLKTLVNN